MDDYPDPVPPLWAVEVISPTDKAEDIADKRTIYVNAGILYGELNPKSKTVQVFAPGKPMVTKGIDDTLDGGDVLTGFALLCVKFLRDSMSNVGKRRLYHQRITHPAFKHAGEVAAWLGAMQGQDYAGTKWAFGVRLPGSTDADIEQAIADGIIMRTWALRGTLHYVAPADIHWLVGLIAPRQIAGNARRYKELELDEPTLRRSTTLIAESLHGGKHLTRTELFAMLEASGIPAGSQRGFYLLQRAGLERVVYQGAMRGKYTTFHALDAGQLQFADAICPGGNGMFMSTIVSDGRIIGTWKRAIKKKHVEITLEPFRPLRADELDVLADASARYSAFLGLPAIIQPLA